jgi:DNA-binding CsgD family transcriptional regulator
MVAWHMRNINEKLQVHSKSEAVAKAQRSGLIR